jgi:hypothetical protein
MWVGSARIVRNRVNIASQVIGVLLGGLVAVRQLVGR